MLVPLKWLRDYVDIDIDVNEFADKMTMSGSKVEKVDFYGENIENVVVGKILEIKQHENADKLIVTKVDIGEKVIQIVTGAQNVSEGDYIPVAVHGAKLPGGVKIKSGKLRGEVSEGMMCSAEELGIDPHYVKENSKDGILLLDFEDSYELGKDVREVLGLNDALIEFEITSNRPDCRCILGIAREAAVTLGKNTKYPKVEVKESDEEIKFKINIENQDLCRRYSARMVRDVKIEPSPYWMQRKLIEAGVRPINNIVDITNFVMLELGQPMHAFDLKQVSTGKIVVRNAEDGEKFVTLDDTERELDKDMLVITNGERSLALAGVMGGANSEVTEGTTEILFESANFKAENVRATSKKLGLRTESSSRFEKGINQDLANLAVDRAAQLVELLGAGRVLKGVVDEYPTKHEPKSITVNVDRINRLIGVEIPASEMIAILESLEFKCELNSSNEIIAKVPSFRLDMEQEADFVEEIARIYGYDKIPTLELEGNPTIGMKTDKQKFSDTVKDSLVALGSDEILTYSFVSPRGIDKINEPKDSAKHNFVKILNPLGEETSVMRTTLIPNMLDVVATNVSHRVEELSVFELGHIFEAAIVEPNQLDRLCIGMYGKGKDFFTLKGMVETVFEKIGFAGYEIEPENNNTTFHPGRCAKIVYNNKNIGTLGELHPDVIENYNLGQRVYVAEIDVDSVFANSDETALYKPLPKYPSTSRDIALVVKDNIYVKQIDDIISANGRGLIEDFKLFDVYTGDQIEKGYKSIAYSITYRSKDRTLTDEDVAKVHDKILSELSEKLDANLRSN
ncbi:phenylalanine--tRNA ligase subunit beta [Clostridioides mangenotii]|uniref:phenylalanine--tRNA ligase subunit beta n=1 Tax=Metaclostridioides mangenotii TaxID=1540 RepID=UPI00214A7036|nr:phenylalanine--tRNA ligase subunit beta [Clostridioides mangenotii]MCR1954386.1 phenylalanine--tRNA ligase subunit beta [Clostridioides mangenotii]